MARLRIGELLVEARVVSQPQLDEALRSKPESMKLGQHLIELGYVSEAQLTQILSHQLSVPWVSLNHVEFSKDLLARVPRELAEKFCAMPIFVRHVKKLGTSLYVAMDDPTHEAALSEIGVAAGLPVKPMIACVSDIRNAIRLYYYGDTTEMPAATSGPSASTRDTAVSPAPVTTRTGAVPAVAAPAPLPTSSTSAAAGPPSSRVEAPLPPPPAPLPPPRAAMPSGAQPPPAPPVGRAPLPTVVDAVEALSDEAVASYGGRAAHDSPDADPELEVEVKEFVPKPRKSRPKMVSLTLLDGSTINVPARGPSPSKPDDVAAGAPPASAPGAQATTAAAVDTLTARELVSALRAAAHGADASDVLGNIDWRAMFAALFALMLKKKLIGEAELEEELRNV